jgi:hypothetical protein
MRQRREKLIAEIRGKLEVIVDQQVMADEQALKLLDTFSQIRFFEKVDPERLNLLCDLNQVINAVQTCDDPVMLHAYKNEMIEILKKLLA